MKVSLARMPHRPTADPVIEIEQAGLVSNVGARLCRNTAAWRGRGYRRLLVARTLTNKPARANRDHFRRCRLIDGCRSSDLFTGIVGIRLKWRRYGNRCWCRCRTSGNRCGRLAIGWFGCGPGCTIGNGWSRRGFWRWLSRAFLAGSDWRWARFQSQPMGFADYRVAADAAKFFRYLAGSQPVFPELAEGINSLVSPRHVAVSFQLAISQENPGYRVAACAVPAKPIGEFVMNDQPQSQQSRHAAVSIMSEPGVAVIQRVNWGGLSALYVKEVRRFFKVQTQTIWAPAITTLLYLVIFSVALGRNRADVLGVHFIDFLAPGLIAMAMIQNSFANASFSLLVGKIQGTIIDYLMPPLSELELLVAMVAASVTRAVLVGLAVCFVLLFWPGVHLSLHHLWAVVLFGLLGASMLAFLGLLTSIWAEKFDHAAAVTNFVVAPLALLSGTFYAIDPAHIHPVIVAVSHANPFFYAISGFRYGFIGASDSPIAIGATVLVAINIALASVCYALLRSGWKLKA